VFAALPQSAHPGATAALTGVDAEDIDYAQLAVKAFEVDYGVKHPKAVATITKDLDGSEKPGTQSSTRVRRPCVLHFVGLSTQMAAYRKGPAPGPGHGVESGRNATVVDTRYEARGLPPRMGCVAGG
jgi:hypothetical protein